MKKWNWKKTREIPTFIIMALLVSGCGGQAYQTGIGASSPVNMGDSSNSSSTTTTTSSTSSTSNLNVPTFNFSIAGLRGVVTPPPGSTVTLATNILTDQTLKIDFTGKSLGTMNSIGTQAYGYTIKSQCIGVDIGMSYDGGKTVVQWQSVTMATDGSGICQNDLGNVAAKPTANFSPLNPGHPTITLILTNAYSNACPLDQTGGVPTAKASCWKQLFYNWVVYGTAAIHTDSTG